MLFLGLTARQVATLMAFASPAYGIWDQLTDAPVAVRGALAGVVLLVGIAFPDRGRTARQVATLMAFASPAYGIWDQLTDAPVAVRGALAVLVLLVGIAFTDR